METKEFGQYIIFDKSNRMLNTVIVKVADGRYFADPRDKEVLESGRLGQHLGWMEAELVTGEFTEDMATLDWEANAEGTSLRRNMPLGTL